MIKHTSFFLILISFITITNCEEPSEYQMHVQQELAKDIRVDSLIFEYKFGMTKDEFLTYSWEINKQGLIVNGSGAEVVQDVDWLKSPARRSYYPKFQEDKIIQLPLQYTYNGWAPWNTHLVSDSLKVDVMNYLENQYNAEFKVLPDSGAVDIHYHIEGNREIRVFTVDEKTVRVLFSDLSKVNLES